MDVDQKPDKKPIPPWLRMALLVLFTTVAVVLFFCWPIFLQQYRESQAKTGVMNKLQEMQRALDAKRASEEESPATAP
jgi:cytochrome c-type biogenesis protein CcmH/NrfG